MELIKLAMKKIIISLFAIIIFSVCSHYSLAGSLTDSIASLNFNSSMNRYLDGCLKLIHGVTTNNTIEVGLAIDRLNPDIKLTGDTLHLAKLRVIPVDTCSNIELKGDCFQFNYSYGVKWLETNGIGPFVEEPTLMRSSPANKPSCKIHLFRLASHSSASYNIRQKGNCQLFIVYEPFTDIDVKINCNNVDISPQKYSTANLWVACWKMPSRTTIRLVFTNTADKAATILIASN